MKENLLKKIQINFCEKLLKSIAKEQLQNNEVILQGVNKNCATQSWINHMRLLLEKGDESDPRGKPTKELIGSSIIVDMNYPIVYHPLRNMNYKFMAAEAEFIANGDNRVCSLSRYVKNIAQFSDDGYILNGNYGEPFNSQLEHVVRTLTDDLDSRQAVLTIWQPNPVKSKDRRCTVSMQFLIRNGKIHTIVNMRSNDIHWGFCYDVFNFTVMTLRVLTRVNEMFSGATPITLGNLHLLIGSSHMYEDYYKKATEIINSEWRAVHICIPERCFTDWNYLVRSLNNTKNGLLMYQNITPFKYDEDWFDFDPRRHILK